MKKLKKYFRKRRIARYMRELEERAVARKAVYRQAHDYGGSLSRLSSWVAGKE